MLRRRSIDINKNCAMPFKKLDGLSELLADYPVAISEFNRQLIIAQHIDQKAPSFPASRRIDIERKKSSIIVSASAGVS